MPAILIKNIFIFHFMNIFVELLDKNFLIKLKRKLFQRIADTLLQLLRRTLQKRNFRQVSFDLGQFELIEILRALRNETPFRSNMHYKYSIVFKGATKLYFTHYSCVVIILFYTGLCRSPFSTISFRKLVFRLSMLYVFFVLGQMF